MFCLTCVGSGVQMLSQLSLTHCTAFHRIATTLTSFKAALLPWHMIHSEINTTSVNYNGVVEH